MITTSEIKISVLVEASRPPTALRAVHQAFDLDEPSATAPTPFSLDRSATARPPQARRRRPTANGHARRPAGHGRPGHLGRRARREPGPGHPVRRPRPARLRREGLPRDRRRRRVRRHDRPERRAPRARRYLSFTVPRDAAERAAEAAAARRPGRGRRSSRRWPSSRSWASACGPTPASPPGCSAPWPSAGSTSR